GERKRADFILVIREAGVTVFDVGEIIGEAERELRAHRRREQRGVPRGEVEVVVPDGVGSSTERSGACRQRKVERGKHGAPADLAVERGSEQDDGTNGKYAVSQHRRIKIRI